uniref:Cytochrome c oxidase assembly protein COX19 n=1 Tax=Hemiselmis andersenii TaxID=464988 RepID=A0A6U2BJF3_HEMAN|mmetsp:Transcript_16571/g.38224  ORF Transcript_16571/g.38224 Transcript_16571/m.38224 type:complete len:119 (-) Transcript_16571:244-600(-)
MTSMGGAATSRRAPVLPPDKGSFPLDHFQECKEHMTRYLKCMKQHGGDHAACKEDTKKYLSCRMENGLMTKEDLGKFGLDENVDLAASKAAQTAHANRDNQRRQEGFVAGKARAQERL